jgi:NTP pyrophosphatase (non-canonical NTP hydrolase)
MPGLDNTKRWQMTTFEAYQEMVTRTGEGRSRLVPLLGLVGEIGDLHATIKKLVLQKDHPNFRSELREELGDILWYLTRLASVYEIGLEEIASENAQKAEALYSIGEISNFDSTFSMGERLPRQFTVRFTEKRLKAGLRVRITIKDVAIGDALTDNAYEDDGYRYHDVFHLGFAAVLGWSPVIRSLLKRKRKSDRKIDEVEDGARALIVEEAISILLFNQGPERGWYRDDAAADIGLYKTIRQMVSGLEVRSCTAKQWMKAIRQGYSAFHLLQQNHGGDVLVDLDNQTLTYTNFRRRSEQ